MGFLLFVPHCKVVFFPSISYNSTSKSLKVCRSVCLSVLSVAFFSQYVHTAIKMNCSNFCSHSSSPQNLHEYVRTGIFTTKTSVGKNSTVVVATYNGTKGAITLFTIHDFSSDQDGKGSSRSASAIPRGRIASKTRVCEAACPTDIRGPALTSKPERVHRGPCAPLTLSRVR